ncbi:MAG: hypothetical protein JO092_06065 [Candidatus Eremiobacteraeota bacterium]|nr:hypothetical protein [Candidatus Eremiobacteraeota bacterium]MBV8374551.1 hypothetical protein [Candidatus Eremiobacteraeota bacterium]
MPERGVKTRQSFFSLIGLTVRLTLRRWALYSAAALVAFGVQAAAAFLWRSPVGIEVSSDVALPLLTALVYARVWGDSNENITSQAVWERFLERAWAVIVIDFFVSWLFERAFVFGAAPTMLQQIGAVLAYTLVLFIIFADAGATIDDGVTVWNVIPLSLLRSVLVTLNPITFARALALFFLNVIVVFGQFTLYSALAHSHAPQALFWSTVPLATVAQLPLAALTLLVYQDAKPVG